MQNNNGNAKIHSGRMYSIDGSCMYVCMYVCMNWFFLGVSSQVGRS